jgi:RNA polymerase sigma-70 factor (ECF subfamily)
MGGEKLENIEQLYRTYFKDVYLYLLAISKNKDLAEELTQETFLKL